MYLLVCRKGVCIQTYCMGTQYVDTCSVVSQCGAAIVNEITFVSWLSVNAALRPDVGASAQKIPNNFLKFFIPLHKIAIQLMFIDLLTLTDIVWLLFSPTFQTRTHYYFAEKLTGWIILKYNLSPEVHNYYTIFTLEVVHKYVLFAWENCFFL